MSLLDPSVNDKPNRAIAGDIGLLKLSQRLVKRSDFVWLLCEEAMIFGPLGKSSNPCPYGLLVGRVIYVAEVSIWLTPPLARAGWFLFSVAELFVECRLRSSIALRSRA